MPSPFPGMDPFLEDPEIFPDLHNGMIIFLQQMLQLRLPELYFATTGTRLWVDTAQRPIWPDVNVLRAKDDAPSPPNSAGGVAVASAALTQPIVVHVSPEEVRETFLDIYAQQSDEPRLVTCIEVLSPTNKTPGAHGRKPYRKKQREVLRSKVHLVEIDLLRGGKHTTAVPRAVTLRQTRIFDYHVCIRRFDHPADYLVYPIRLDQRLPQIAIPLLPGVADVSIDLQTVFEQSYDVGPYRRSIRYAERTPVPPLKPEQVEWATRVLREKGLLPPAAAPQP